MKKVAGWVLIIFGVLGILASVALSVNQPKPPREERPGVSLATSSPPSSAVVSKKTIADYSVPSLDPKYIAVPSIGVNKARILKLGLLSDGSIATPNNIYDTGWYEASSRPGQPGAMFVYGHVSNWTANGVFYALKQLVPGDSISITSGNNTTYTYKVTLLKVYPYNNVNMAEVLSPIDPKLPGLNLMTCTGAVIKGTSEFNERLVVFTSLVAS